jgi:hypothetical protein
MPAPRKIEVVMRIIFLFMVLSVTALLPQRHEKNIRVV